MLKYTSIQLALLSITLLLAFSSCAGWFMKVKKDADIVVADGSKQFHNSLSFVADAHADPLMRGKKLWRNNSMHVNFPKMREGNVALQIFGVVTKSGVPKMDFNKEPKVNMLGVAFPGLMFKKAFKKGLFQIGKLHKAEKKDDKFHIIQTKADLEELVKLREKDNAHIGGMLCIEGIHCIKDSIEKLDELYNKGVSIIGLSHFFDNRYAGSQSGMKKYGLTEKGIQLIEKINDLGLLIDLAHASENTIDSVLKFSKKPPIISHVGCAHVQDSPRNLNDEYLKKIMDKGGIVGVMFFNPLKRKAPDIHKIADNIMHLVKLNNGNAQNISLGSDYDGMTIVPFDISELHMLTHILLERGMPQTDVELIMGENLKTFFLENLPG
ncbi:MAG: membrane dipeptidase [Bacteroidota bacterium]